MIRAALIPTGQTVDLRPHLSFEADDPSLFEDSEVRRLIAEAEQHLRSMPVFDIWPLDTKAAA